MNVFDRWKLHFHESIIYKEQVSTKKQFGHTILINTSTSENCLYRYCHVYFVKSANFDFQSTKNENDHPMTINAPFPLNLSCIWFFFLFSIWSYMLTLCSAVTTILDFRSTWQFCKGPFKEHTSKVCLPNSSVVSDIKNC